MKNLVGSFSWCWKVLPVLAFFIVFVCTQQDVWAQGNADGSIHGAVTDPSGAGVTGVKVTVTNNQAGGTQTVFITL
jgi:hypothetical protein